MTYTFASVYARALGMLRPVRGLVATLVGANLLLAAIPFVDPILFGRAIDLLTHAQARGAEATFHDGVRIFGLWAAVGVGGILARILVSLHADRLAHRQRLGATAAFFAHVLHLHLAYHRSSHSGRLLKIMLGGSDRLFGLWLSMFREHLSTLVALLVLMPMTILLNWQMATLLMVLTIGSALLTAYVTRRTLAAQGEVESYNTALAERAGDAISNVAVVQSFGRLGAEMRMMREVIERLLSAQFPVLNWWAVVSVLQGAAATVTVISIFALGAWLNLKGEVTVGEVVTFMGFASHLIGRMDQVVGFVNSLFMDLHALGEYFEVLDTQSAVADRPGARPLPPVRGQVEFEDVCFSYDGRRDALADITFGRDDPHRRGGHPRRDARVAARQHRDRLPGEHALFPQHRRQPAGGQTGRHRRRARAGRAPGLRPRLHPAAVARLPDPHRRARGHSERRRAPAAVDRPGAAEKPADPHPGRGDQRARRGHRGAGAAGLPQPEARPHHLRDRPPPGHHPRRRPDPGPSTRSRARGGSSPA